LNVRSRPALGWRVKTGRNRAVPLVDELTGVLRGLVAGRTGGPVFLRRQFDPSETPAGMKNETALLAIYAQRLATKAEELSRAPTRIEQARIARGVWRDAGALKADQVRTSFIRAARKAGLEAASCPKSWRHTFATLLQDANVDPLIRQLTLGHQPSFPAEGALGMTSVYTHSRLETQKREIIRALRHWQLSLRYAREWAVG
jgi:integrase